MVSINEKTNMEFYNNALESYLRNYDIARELFDVSKVKSECDKKVIKRYYDSVRQHADVLVTDDEFVGSTYKNLDIISELFEENKLVKNK